MTFRVGIPLGHAYEKNNLLITNKIWLRSTLDFILNNTLQ